MGRVKNHPSVLDRLGSLFRANPKPATTVSPKTDRPAETDDVLASFPVRPGAHGIQVVEVEQTEFLLEWGQSILEEAAHHAHDEQGAVQPVDRRLPQFDRRRNGDDRRQGDRRNGHDPLPDDQGRSSSQIHVLTRPKH